MNLKTIVLSLFVLTSSIFSQSFSKVDSLASVLLAKFNLKGIGIVGTLDDKIIFSKGYGIANNENQFNAESTRIYIASNTKSMVGLSMAQLAAENKIDYSESIEKYIDPAYFHSDIDLSSITISRLLSHTHGLSNDPLVFRTAYSGEYPTDLKELLKFTVYKQDTASSDFNYSNLGYLLAGIIIEKVTGMNWRDYVEKNIFTNLGMENTSIHINFSKKQEALPFDYISDDVLSSKKTENTLHAAGGVYSTLSDMGKWLIAVSSHKSFSKTVYDNYLTPQADANQNMGPFSMDKYGNGWILGALMGMPLNFHFGSFKGYESVMSFMPDRKTGVFVFVNEMTGGLRIAAMLTAYYYMTLLDVPEADKKINSFYKFIEPLYQNSPPKKEIFTLTDSDRIRGSYKSEKYGNLLVDKLNDGFHFTIGNLTSLGYKGETENQILVEWVPGIVEKLNMVIQEKQVKLEYGDFDAFYKL